MDMASAFVNKYGYGSIPIHTIFRGMNIHLPAILMFTKGTRFWPIPIWTYKQYAKSAVPWAWKFLRHTPRWPWNCVGTIWSMWQTPCFCCLVPDIVMFVDCWDSNNIYIHILWYMFGNYSGQKCKDRPESLRFYDNIVPNMPWTTSYCSFSS